MAKTKQKKPVYKKFDPQVYPVKLAIVRHATEEYLNKKFRGGNFDLEGYNALTVGVVSEKSSDAAIVVIAFTEDVEKDSLQKKINTIAHESHHFAAHVLGWVGAKHSRDSEEAYAYLTGWCAESCATVIFGKK